LSESLKKRLAELGVLVKVYLDDFLLICRTKLECQRHFQITLDLFKELGLLVKHHKCQLPCQRLEFLGITLDVCASLATLSDERVAKLQRKVQAFLAKHLNQPTVQRRALASIAGSLNWFAPFYDTARALLHPIHLALYLVPPGTTQLSWHPQAKVGLGPECLAALKRWQLLLQGKPSRKVYLFPQGGGGFWAGSYTLPDSFNERKDVFVPDPSLTGTQRIAVLTTDACPWAYGGFSGTQRFSGRFSDSQMGGHINAKELLAVFFGLQIYAGREFSNCRVLVRSDNTTAVAALNRRSHFLEHLDSILSDIRDLCHTHNLDVLAIHLPGC
jgi:hypothetical protein